MSNEARRDAAPGNQVSNHVSSRLVASGLAARIVKQNESLNSPAVPCRGRSSREKLATMSFQYLTVEEAIPRPGLRLVVVGQVPSPWGQVLPVVRSVSCERRRLRRQATDN